MTTTVHHVSEQQPGDVFIGRPSKWGNPYSHLRNSRAKFRTGSREEAIAKYEDYILTRPALLAALSELHGKRLICFCRPLSCHGDVLARLADQCPG